MTVTIRRAKPADAAVVTAIVQEAYADYVPRIGRRPAPMDDDQARAIEEGIVWVAERDRTVIGVLAARLREADLHIDNVAVAAAARGSGSGALLLAHAEAYARDHGRSWVRLYTNAAMTENLGYYPRRGYVETGRGEQDGFRRVFFSKRLDRD